MHRNNDYNLICIGSGPAGQRAAIQAAKLGKKVAVIEKKQFAGGVCIETGTIPSKTFREAVRRVYSRPGLELTDPFTHKSRTRPAMQQLIGHVGRVIQREIGIVHDALARNDVELINGRAEFLDPHTVRTDSLTGQRTLTADHFLIAVGTEPSNPRALDPDGQTVITSDNVLGLKKFMQYAHEQGYISSEAALDVLFAAMK
jgi:NAD(P) transhydrogenase